MRRVAARAHRARPRRAEFARNVSTHFLRIMRRVGVCFALKPAKVVRALLLPAARLVAAHDSSALRKGEIWLCTPRAVRWAHARYGRAPADLFTFTPNYCAECVRCTLLDIARALGACASCAAERVGLADVHRYWGFPSATPAEQRAFDRLYDAWRS
jgi:hypothetical protein